MELDPNLCTFMDAGAGNMRVTRTERYDSLGRRVYEWEIRSWNAAVVATGELHGPNDRRPDPTARMMMGDLISYLLTTRMPDELRDWVRTHEDWLASMATRAELES